MRPLSTRAARIAASLGAALLLGLLGPVTGKWDSSFCVVVSTIFSSGWPWVCYAFLVGYFCRPKTESALLGSFGLAVGVVAYYVFKDMSPAIPDGTKSVSDPSGIAPDAAGHGDLSQILVWGIAAFILGAPIGILGNLSRASGICGLVLRLIVPLAAFCESSVRLAAEGDRYDQAVGITWNTTRLVAGAVVLALAGHAIWFWWKNRHARPRSDDGVCETTPQADRS